MLGKLVFFVVTSLALASAQEVTSCICLDELPVAREFINPLIVTNAHDGSDRLFVGQLRA